MLALKSYQVQKSYFTLGHQMLEHLTTVSNIVQRMLTRDTPPTISLFRKY